MCVSVALAAVVVATTNFISPEVSYFPKQYFELEAKRTLQNRAMVKWPGPAQVVDLWRAGDLNPREKMAILLGLSASHDPVLLPLYREALSSANPRLRMAAAYGYRDLLGDALPNVAGGIDETAVEQLTGEMDAVAGTLRSRPLVELWLQALLMTEDASMPGWRGIGMRRNPSTCLRALEKIVDFEDFRYLATAFRVAESRTTRIGLMQLLEAVTLQRFFSRPGNTRSGGGVRDLDDGLRETEAFVAVWLDQRCSTDADAILTSSANAMGARGVRPLGPDSWDLWVKVLEQTNPGWRMMAARRLYQLGGRWSSLSMFRASSGPQTEAYEDLLNWYRPVPPRDRNRSVQTKRPQNPGP